jgi:hypothetical protein
MEKGWGKSVIFFLINSLCGVVGFYRLLFLTCGRVWKSGLCVQFCFELDADEKTFCKIMC